MRRLETLAWEFRLQPDTSWSWHRVSEGIALDSPDTYANFGSALHAAMECGFSPSRETWQVKNGLSVTLFVPGQRPVRRPVGSHSITVCLPDTSSDPERPPTPGVSSRPE